MQALIAKTKRVRLVRALMEIVDSFTGTLRAIIGAITLGIMAIGGMVTLGASYFVPKATASLGEKVERLGEQQLQTDLKDRRAAGMGKDGWGYGAATDVDDGDASRPSGTAGDGWAQ